MSDAPRWWARPLRVISAAALCATAMGCGEEPALPDRASGQPVRFEVARRGEIRPTIALLGTVRPSATISLAAARGGRISYPPRFASGLRTGAEVASGETVASLENEAARLQLAEAKLAHEQAATELQRLQRASEAGILEREKLEAAAMKERLTLERQVSAERESGRLTLAAPRKGRLVISRAWPPLSEVPGGTVIAEIAADGPPCVESWAAAGDREALRPGQRSRFVAADDEKTRGEGRIREVASVVDEAGTVRVVIDVTDARGLPAPGEGVDVIVELERRADALTVPEQALVVSEGGSSVFLVMKGSVEGDRARRVKVEVGGRGGGRAEVRRGLTEGDMVIVSGAALLSDGALIEAARADPAPPLAGAASGAK